MFSGWDMALLNQFLACVSNAKNLKLKIMQNIQKRIIPNCKNMMAQIWHFVNSIRGNQRQEEMLTNVNVYLAPFPSTSRNIASRLGHSYYIQFNVYENKYFDFEVPNCMRADTALRDIPATDMTGKTMINSITVIYEDCWFETSTIPEFIQYIVK
jgi:hypothetical protein